MRSPHFHAPQPALRPLAEQVLAEALQSTAIPLAERAALALRYLELERDRHDPVHHPKAKDWDQHQHPGAIAEPVHLHAVSPSGDALPSFSPPILPVRYHLIPNFLSATEHQSALTTALDQRDRFVGSSTTTNAADYRRSSVLYATFYPDLFELLRRRILKHLPQVTQALNLDPFLVSQVEMQLTAHNDGCFYKIHNDSGSPETATRLLTYVYYFHQEPRAYGGGALRIYETDPLGDATLPSEVYEDIVPENNSIIFFESRYKHEVLPVTCPSQQFEHSRFTLNGWLRQTAVHS
ncbi:MAG: hypothetical protein Fur0042_19380 [Cyanophyceae cyanobacterium]